MALGRKSENQIPPIGGATQPPVAPPVPVAPVPPAPAAPIDTGPAVVHHDSHSGADVVTALDARLQELQATVAAMVDKAVDDRMPTPTPHTPGDLNLDQDVLEASRTLQLAKRTADATIAEARSEAEALLAAARAESAAVLQAAHEAADRELAAQRTALIAETQAWEARRRDLVAEFERLDGQLSEHRQSIDEAHALVTSTLSGPTLTTHIDSPPEPVAATPVIDPAAPVEVPVVEAAFEPTNGQVEPTVTFGAAPEVETPPLFPTDAVPAPPVFGEPPAAADRPGEDVTTFGTPPPPPPPTPFYPWSSDQEPGPEAAEPSDGDESFEAPKPVQRRGLFGH